MHNIDMALTDDLRKAIRADGRSWNQLAADSGISTPVVSRFVRGLRDVTTATAGRLCDALGLELRPKARRKAGKHG